MDKIITNVAIILGLLTVVFGGYYVYTQYSDSFSYTETNEQTMRDMVNNTKLYQERSQSLSKITMDISLFEDERFRSLVEYSTPIVEQPIGRSNPFEETNAN